MRRNPRVGVIIAAGGKGRRLGGGVPKQFRRMGGIPIIERTMRLFQEHPGVHEIVIVAPPRYRNKVVGIARRAKCSKVTRVVSGGAERQHSVWNGMNAFLAVPDILLVHDAVRPLVSVAIVTGVIQEAARHKAAVAAVRVKDTIKVEQPKGFVSSTLDRDRLRAVQTPQGFRVEVIREAHLRAKRSRYIGTDEASLVERFLGIPVRVVEGDYRNLKITTKEDLEMAEFLLQTGKMAKRVQQRRA